MLNLREFSPCVLLAMPQLCDPNFFRAVIVLADFTSRGAFGVVVNRPLELTLDTVQSASVEIADRYRAAPLWFGGPVHHQQALVLSELRPGIVRSHPDAAGSGIRAPDTGETMVWPLMEGLALANPKAMVVGHESTAMYGDFKVLVGCAGWSSNQLDQEIASGSWLVVPLTKSLIFSEPATMWERAIRSLGVQPSALQVPSSVMKH